MFKKILIANRGEIACRVMKTAKKMGIATVAVYSDADADALHVQMADEAVHIGASASAESYLVIDKIIAACKDTGAEAVHPGYGFLSENKAFQIALDEAGIAFIGPGAFAIEAMGDKIESKKLADKAGVSTVPGHIGVIKDTDEAAKIAGEIGYPVMIKASAGGGGKGMRVAWDEEEAREGFERATSEAKSSFGDDRVFIEKFVEEPRHIEIQVLADGQGTTLYLAERECSIQRRHQKVIEEAPSPFLDEATRQAMGEQAVALAEAVDYKSAGTVEFIVDKDKNFYFLEMNTRLQVEHPVTELITGLDLVEWMIRIAFGEKLTLKQSDITITGWALESRIYAEDPYRNFLPSTGRLVRYLPPEETEGVRVDTGVYDGGEISMFYDPMVAKLVTYGADRNEAIEKMRHALDGFYVRGISHNIPFLAAVMEQQRFIDGRLTTNYIAEEFPDGFSNEDLPASDPDAMAAIAAMIHHAEATRNAMITGQAGRKRREVSGDWVVKFDADTYIPVLVTSVSIQEGAGAAEVNGKVYTLKSDWRFGRPLMHGTLNGSPFCMQIDQKGVGYELFQGGALVDVLVLSPLAAEMEQLMPVKVPPDMSAFLLSPMPGKLVTVSVTEGQEVKAGEPLCMVEAMKMENILRAERDATIAKIHVSPGDSLAVDAIIMAFEQTGD